MRPIMRLVPRKPEIAFMRDKVQPFAPSKDSGEALALRQQILDLVTRYAEIGHKRKSFVPGTSPRPCSREGLWPRRGP